MSRKLEWVFSFLLVVIGALYFYAASQYPMGEATSPGPGMMPRILGVVFVGLAGYLLVMGWLSRKSGEDEDKEKPNAEEAQGKGRHTPLWVTIILVAYTAAIDFLGYATGSFLVVLILGKVMGLEGWIKPIILSIGVAVCTQLLFGYVLDVPLPIGTIFGG
jgi:hypothetical protein